jgi:hypothetical protein
VLNQDFLNFVKHFIQVAENPEVGLIKISLKNTVGTIQRAVLGKMKYCVTATVVKSGGRAGSQKPPFKPVNPESPRGTPGNR